MILLVNPFELWFSILETIILIFAMAVVVIADDSNSNGECRMEIQYYTDFNCDTPLTNAYITVDGECHTVETDLSPSDDNYSLLPGLYRAQCSSDNTLIFLDSACVEGTCSTSATCNRDDSIGGSLFYREPGQTVSQPGTSYCETLYDEQNSMFYTVFGDCSLPGCNVDGVINPSPSEPTTSSPVSAPNNDSPTAPPSPTPSPITPPTRSPIKPSNPPPTTANPTDSPIESPTIPAPMETPTVSTPVPPPTSAPIRVNATIAPISSSPVSLPTTDAPVTNAPIQTSISPVAKGEPTSSPVVPTDTPSFSPFVPGDPTLKPNNNVRTPSPIVGQPTIRSPTQSIDQSSSSSDNTIVILGAIGGSITIFVLFVILFFVRKQCVSCKSINSKNGSGVIETTTSSEKSKELNFGNDHLNRVGGGGVGATNEIWCDPNRDDVSTLDGGTLPDMINGVGGDELTASVNMDFDFNKNRYRSSSTVDERSRFTSSTNPTAFTGFSKLGIQNTSASIFDHNHDDQSFEQQFADMDDEEIMTVVGSMNIKSSTNATVMNDIANRIRPFEVQVPPGMLGLVIDTPNGSVPVIRAIKPSSVLYPQVQVGDRLISVDQQNVTNMTALAVSQLITQKQDQHRVFVFCRLALSQQDQEEQQ